MCGVIRLNNVYDIVLNKITIFFLNFPTKMYDVGTYLKSFAEVSLMNIHNIYI